MREPWQQPGPVAVLVALGFIVDLAGGLDRAVGAVQGEPAGAVAMAAIVDQHRAVIVVGDLRWLAAVLGPLAFEHQHVVVVATHVAGRHLVHSHRVHRLAGLVVVRGPAILLVVAIERARVDHRLAVARAVVRRGHRVAVVVFGAPERTVSEGLLALQRSGVAVYPMLDH